MKLCRHREVEPVVLTVGDALQQLQSVVPASLLLAERFRAANSEVTHRSRARAAGELGQRGVELGIDGYLNARTRRGHLTSVPPP
jgi:hypothetical protein